MTGAAGGKDYDRFFWLLCFASGLFMAVCMAVGTRNAGITSATWPAVSGRVIDIEIVDGADLSETQHHAVVRYTFGGKSYVSTVRKVRHSVRTGDTITFYLNPEDPEDLVDFRVGTRGNFIFGYVVIAISCAVMLFSAVKIALASRASCARRTGTMNKKFVLLICLSCAAALAAAAGGAERRLAAGAYSLSGGVMNGKMEIRETGAGYWAVISLTSPAGHVAHFEGAAAGDGGTVKIWRGDEGYGAELTLSFEGEDTVIITENEGASMYHGMNATFEGTYQYALKPVS